MLRIEKLNAYYGDSHIIRDFTLEVKSGEIYAILGRNGMGKTTLLKAIMGINPPRKNGGIHVDGLDISSHPADKVAKLGVAYVPQGRLIFPNITVHDNLRLALNSRPKGKRQIPEEIYEYFPRLKERLDQRGGTLSGGEQQMLAIARALTQGPKVMLLDEPTAGIQPNIVQRLQSILKRINAEKGITMLLVEQKLDFALALATNYSIITKGEIVEQGETKDFNMERLQAHLAV